MWLNLILAMRGNLFQSVALDFGVDQNLECMDCGLAASDGAG